jgi:glycosyltransferase involved in cell wall biosynthesis
MARIVDAARPFPATESGTVRYSTDPQGPEELTVLPPDTQPWLTVVVPTRNEEGSIELLLERLEVAFSDTVAEVLFVDDSTDRTPEVVRAAARNSGLAVRLLHRPRGSRNGLGGAVAAGLKHARGPWAVVMDGDLQHPTELAPRLVAIGNSRQLDLIAGTRYQGPGAATGLDGGYRRAVSRLATMVAKVLFPRRLARLSDPMSGFFAVRLAALDLAHLSPTSFKILLEIVVRHPQLQVAEVPFVFGVRRAGESKASAREGLRFVHHLLRLRLLVLRHQISRSTSTTKLVRLRRMVAFGLVGLTGVAVNEAALWMFSGQLFHHHYLIAAVLATEASTTWNFTFIELLVFRGSKPGRLVGRGVRFYVLNHLALLLRLPLLAILVSGFGADVLLANLITLMLLFAVRFVIADSAIYGKPIEVAQKQPMRITVDLTEPLATGADVPNGSRSSKTGAASAKPSKPGSWYLPYRYAIDGIVTVGSQVPLRELEYFRAQWLGNDVDLSIRVDHVGSGVPRTRALMTQYTSPPGLSYQEHLGRLGANFRVDIGSRVEVTCSPALANSPHVLYTNVIEALLRFLAVSHGVILLHSACLELNGRGMLLSARTDTGKTSSVLRLLREYGARFLSDDMTIIDPKGTATCFPKPLTISHHTLRALHTGDLTSAEWRRLKLQSRLHSKEGRQFGLVLARLNIPIMGVNSLTQRVVPPPKYNVDRLVECRIIRTTQVDNLFIIERGAPALDDVPFDEAIETLVENTDDAYGFPPFRQMAPSIVIGQDDYGELRRKERDILCSAMGNVRVRRLSSDTFSWADDIATMFTAAEPGHSDAMPSPMLDRHFSPATT